MNRSKIYLLGAAVLAVVVVKLLTVTRVAWAHGGDVAKIHSCVNTQGSLRVVGANESCRIGETPLDWNIQGPQGPAGPTTVQYITVQALGHAKAFCPAGTKVTGGGAFVEGLPWTLRHSFPIADESGVVASGITAIGWQAASSDGNGIVSSTAICASP